MVPADNLAHREKHGLEGAFDVECEDDCCLNDVLKVCDHCGSISCPSLRYSAVLGRYPLCPSLSICRPGRLF